jgi:restriction system protein
MVIAIPDSDTLLLPVLRIFSDDKEHSAEEVRGFMVKHFEISADQLLQKTARGTPIFHNRVALALANLQGAPHGGRKLIAPTRRGFYRITEQGKALLNRNPSSLSRGDI